MKSVLLILFILLAGFQINAQSGIKLRFNQNGDFKIVQFNDFKRLAAIFEKAKTPWAMVFGNHESEHNLPRNDLAAFIEKLPFCLNKNNGISEFNLA